jgi:hypothetical protein
MVGMEKEGRKKGGGVVKVNDVGLSFLPPSSLPIVVVFLVFLAERRKTTKKSKQMMLLFCL